MRADPRDLETPAGTAGDPPSGSSPAAGTRRRMLAGVASLASAAVLARAGGALAQAVAPAGGEAAAPELPAVGSVLRLPEVPLLDGGVFRPADADARVLVVYWWASWCPFCAQQSPHMQTLWERERGRGLRMLALSIDRDPANAKAHLAKHRYTFPAAMATVEVNRVLPKPRGLPVTVVRGRDGRVLQAERGQLFPEDVEALAQWLDARS